MSDTLVIGESNKLAVLAATKVAAGEVGGSLGPIVFIGPSGCGKTRLLATIAERVACCQDGRILISFCDLKGMVARAVVMKAANASNGEIR